jgi:hypothetical protein
MREISPEAPARARMQFAIHQQRCHRHAIQSESPGLVSAQDGRGTKGLDCRSSSREYASLGDAPGSHHQKYRQHEREFLW